MEFLQQQQTNLNKMNSKLYVIQAEASTQFLLLLLMEIYNFKVSHDLDAKRKRLKNLSHKLTGMCTCK